MEKIIVKTVKFLLEDPESSSIARRTKVLVVTFQRNI